jgi:hypothetical protein
LIKFIEILKRYEKSILTLTGNVSDMKKTMNQVLKKLKKFGR